ncbi:peptidoglycan DD-metalloendopeptidase family protein [Limosilactobacillus pulli]|uniref:peptidoglycan DD-metalloendopeptidase family protein n=1 Tax=Limosilactobacillus pulli TaxID=2991833 RepID=UPI0024BA4EA7|nr:peptidoglycan DD-metalloendopeptidase family protein [Limosilactobacillus pulli]
MAKPSLEVKTRFKMYKKGKLWLVAAAATAGLMAGGNVAQADSSTTTSNSDQAVVANTNTGASNDNNSNDNSTVALTATTAASSDSQAATVSEDTVSTTASESTSATDTVQKATSSTDQESNSASQVATEASKAVETVEQPTKSTTQNTQNDAKAETVSSADTNTVSMTTAAAADTNQSSTSATKTTEVYSNGHWYLKDQNGKNLTGWQKLSGERTVYYNTVGQMQYGLQTINGKIYYFNTWSGERYANREAQINGKWYNFTSDGSASIGFTKLANGKTVYYNAQGQMQYGLQTINSKIYYFNTWSGERYANREAQINGKWYNFTNDGSASTGFTKLSSGKTVYYNAQGQMQYGLQTINSKIYYFNTWSGERYANREAQINGKWYNFTNDGSASTGFTKLSSGKTVYYNAQGQMQYGLQTINSKIYYFNTWSGERYANREAQINGKWYNFTNDGSASTGFTKLASGKLVYYNAQGQMQYGEQKINNNWYYFNTWSGEVARGWYTLPDGRVVYYMLNENGQGQGMLHGQQEINGLTYYLNVLSGAKETGVVYNANTKLLQCYGGKNGSLVKSTTLKLDGNTISVDNSGNIALKDGENEINGQWYYYDSKTKTVKTGWYKLSNNREVYYDLTTAQMVHGEKQIDGYWYYFNVLNGAEFVSQFASLSNNRIAYYNDQGHMVYGEQKINGSWYYFNPVNGQEAISQFITLNDGRKVYYNDQGHMVKGWQTINGNTFYFNLANGNMYTGTHYIDGTKHTFGSDGVEDTWGWPFPADGRGYFTGAQLFGVNAGGEFRLNGFHDGLDFGSIDHPGYEVHAVHKGTVTGIGYASGLDWYVLIDTGEYLTVYQEAFSSRSNIWVSVGQQVNVGDVIGGRTTAHLHLGITRQKNFNVALANSFNNNGTWINPLTLLGN